MLCTNCPLKCNTDRNLYSGLCGAKELKAARASLHFDEEPVIRGKGGSGTVFFCGCPLSCVFCQNFEVSRNLTGKIITASELAEIFKKLENTEAENINLVSPTTQIAGIIEALTMYKPKIPVVYNSSGYENIETVEALKDYIDIYMPDIKFFSPEISKRYTGKKNYFEIASKAVLKMAKQAQFKIQKGVMKKGMIIRHLILPLCTDDSVNILNFIKDNFSDKVYVSLMSQYTPFGDISGFPELSRKITAREYDKVVNHAVKLNFKNCYIQGLSSGNKKFIPVWNEFLN